MQKDKNTLVHHGILGMKWGVRRTPEQLGNVKPGKRREKKKRASEMSNAELREANERYRLEREYSVFSSKPKTLAKARFSRAMTRIVDKILDRALDAALDTTISAGKKWINSQPSSTDPEILDFLNLRG